MSKLIENIVPFMVIFLFSTLTVTVLSLKTILPYIG
jgi:hypothetical protein